MQYSREAIQELIEQAGLSRVRDGLERLMKPSIRLTLRPADEANIPVGASKFGGLPDLSPGAEWPRCADLPPEEGFGYVEKQCLGGPLWFLGQVNLADTAPLDTENALPRSGLLSFFAAIQRDGFPCDGVTPDCWRVLYHNGDLSALRRTPVPPVPDALREALAQGSPLPGGYTSTPCAVEFSLSYTLPSHPDVGMTEEEADRYWEAFWNVFHGEDEARRHQILGYEGPLQGSTGEMAGACEATDIEEDEFTALLQDGDDSAEWWQKHKEAVKAQNEREAQLGPEGLRAEQEEKEQAERAQRARWRLLLQLDTEPEAGLFWPAWGRGYFCITHDALAARDFDRACLVNQHT